MSKQDKQKMKIEKLEKLILIVFIFLIGSVSAFGIGSPYHKDNPLELSSGEIKEINFNLQNMAGPENITARASVTRGFEILELVDSGDILVPVGGSVDVKAKVSIPSDAKIGDVYPVEITFNTITKGEAGTFGLGSSIGRNFDVIITPTAEERARLEEQKQITSWVVTYLIIGIVILIVIILIIWFILKKRRKK